MHQKQKERKRLYENLFNCHRGMEPTRNSEGNTVDFGYKGPLGTALISPLYLNVPYN